MLKYFCAFAENYDTEKYMMKKLIMSFICLLSVLLLVACAGGGGASDASGNTDASMQNTSVKMTATVTNVLDAKKIEVDVIEGEYGASGIFWVIVSDTTVLSGQDGERIALSDVKAGDTVEIRYGGQVMMSYPPQIVAGSITILE